MTARYRPKVRIDLAVVSLIGLSVMSLPKSVHGIEGREIFVVLRRRWRSCWTCSLKGDQFPLQRAPKWRATRFQVLVWRASQLRLYICEICFIDFVFLN